MKEGDEGEGCGGSRRDGGEELWGEQEQGRAHKGRKAGAGEGRRVGEEERSGGVEEGEEEGRMVGG